MTTLNLRGRRPTVRILRGRRTLLNLRGRHPTLRILRGRRPLELHFGALQPVFWHRVKYASQDIHGDIFGQHHIVGIARRKIVDRLGALFAAKFPYFDQFFLPAQPFLADQLQVVEQRAKIPTLGAHYRRLPWAAWVINAFGENQSHVAQMFPAAITLAGAGLHGHVLFSQFVVMLLAQDQDLHQVGIIPIGQAVAFTAQVNPEMGHQASHRSRAEVQNMTSQADLERRLSLGRRSAPAGSVIGHR